MPFRLQFFRCALCLIECPGVLATCKLSIKQTFCDWIDSWQPDRKFVCQWSPPTAHAPVLGLYLIGSYGYSYLYLCFGYLIQVCRLLNRHLWRQAALGRYTRSVIVHIIAHVTDDWCACLVSQEHRRELELVTFVLHGVIRGNARAARDALTSRVAARLRSLLRDDHHGVCLVIRLLRRHYGPVEGRTSRRCRSIHGVLHRRLSVRMVVADMLNALAVLLSYPQLHAWPLIKGIGYNYDSTVERPSNRVESKSNRSCNSLALRNPASHRLRSGSILLPDVVTVSRVNQVAVVMRPSLLGALSRNSAVRRSLCPSVSPSR